MSSNSRRLAHDSARDWQEFTAFWQAATSVEGPDGACPSIMPQEPAARVRNGKRKRAAQIGLTCTTFIALCLWIGPDAACWLIGVVAFVTGWIWLCSRSAWFSYFTGVLLVNLIGWFITGLYWYRSRSAYRRRRW